MILRQLLAVGHTFTSAKNNLSPYRLAKQNWLPRFGPDEELPHGVALFPSRSATSSQGPPRFRSPAKQGVLWQQGELSLDTVKVVRNDLDRTDFEIVPKRAAPVRAAVVPRGAVLASAVEPVSPARWGWATRWFRSVRGARLNPATES